MSVQLQVRVFRIILWYLALIVRLLSANMTDKGAKLADGLDQLCNDWVMEAEAYARSVVE